MIIFGIDPGPKQSAWVAYDTEQGRPFSFRIEPNEDLLERLQALEIRRSAAVVIEWITVAAVAGAEVYQTCRWIGRFEQATIGATVPVVLLPRGDVLQHFFGKRNVKSADSLIRRTMLDRHGGDGAKGVKARPGPLYGFSSHCWQALAAAIAYADTHPLNV